MLAVNDGFWRKDLAAAIGKQLSLYKDQAELKVNKGGYHSDFVGFFALHSFSTFLILHCDLNRIQCLVRSEWHFRIAKREV